MSEGSAVWAESLTKTFCSGRTKVTVFQELTLQVRQGERLAIIGESGAGKSTLLHLLGALDRPTSGEIKYHGQSIEQLDDCSLAAFRNREIGFVWQNPSLLPEFTAAENVAMPLLIRGEVPGSAMTKAGEMLEEVGLSERCWHRAGELSGGEQQRVALARALVSGPKLLLADEPTGSLDQTTGESIISLLTRLHEVHRLTSIFVTHNLSFARRCDRVLELKKGSLHASSLMEPEATGVERDATRLGGGTYV